jgi:hypothetical protein
MKDTMHAMKTMMISMQQFVEASMPQRARSHSDDSSHRSEDSFKDVKEFATDRDNYSSEAAANVLPMEEEFITQSAKRGAPLTKGDSPEAKRAQSESKRGGRGAGAGRTGSRRQGLRTRLTNQFEPLTRGKTPSAGGENK